MRNQKALIALLNGLVNLLSREADRNPEFAEQLDALLSAIPSRAPRRRRISPQEERQSLPDVYAEFASRGDSEFQLWLRDQPLAVLRGLIRLHDLDPTRRTAKWKNDPEKFGTFITEKIRSRLARGSGFSRLDNSS